jgi:putative MFS transporter
MFLYAFASLVMAFQMTATGLALWRFLSSIGLGLELVVVNTMVSELVSSRYRGRAVALYQFISLLGAPVVAFVAMELTSVHTRVGSGWRLVTLVGVALIGLVLWFRRRLPESPRWLAAMGRSADADRALVALESAVERSGVALQPPVPVNLHGTQRRTVGELFRPPYLRRTVMFIVQQLAMPIGFYGFSSWVPTLLIAQGIDVSKSLLYAFLIALATPATPLLMLMFADRFDRKWQITLGGAACAVLMLGFSMQVTPAVVVLFGVGLTVAKSVIITAIAGYMPECYPTAIRGAGHGIVYGVSRVTAALSGPIIAFVLASSGPRAVSALIAGSFLVVALVTLLLGPRVRGRTLEELNP